MPSSGGSAVRTFPPGPKGKVILESVGDLW